MFLPSRTAMLAEADDSHMLMICREQAVGACVRSLRDCAAGAVLDRFTGDIGPIVSQHSLQVRDGVHIRGTRYIGYLSHGCDPNCRLDMARSELVSLRAILAGEILTIDYAATEDRLYRQFACACHAPSCRRWITGRADPVNEAGHEHLAGLCASEAF